MNTTITGSAQNPAPLYLVGANGGKNDPASGNSGPTAQYFLPGFDIPDTAPNPYTGYPGYQGISKDRCVRGRWRCTLCAPAG